MDTTSAIGRLGTGQRQYEEGLVQWQAGKAELDKNQEALEHPTQSPGGPASHLEQQPLAAGPELLPAPSGHPNSPGGICQRRSPINDAQAQYDDGLQKLEEGRQELQDGWEEYNEGYDEAQESLQTPRKNWRTLKARSGRLKRASGTSTTGKTTPAFPAMAPTLTRLRPSPRCSLCSSFWWQPWWCSPP